MRDIITENKTGSAALSYSVSPGNGFELVEFTLKLSAIPTTSELLTVTKNAYAGAAYDAPIYSKDLSTLTAGLPPGVYFSCNGEDFDFEAGDTLDFAWTNTDTKTFGLQVKFRRK